MKLDNQTLALIAVGASVSANCQPCLEHNVRTAIKCGADAAQITEAIEIGKRVQQGAANKMDKFVLGRSEVFAMPINSSDGGCGCDA